MTNHELGLFASLLNASATARTISGGDNDDDFRLKPTIGTKCPTLLRNGARVLLYVTHCIDPVTHHGLW